MLRYYVDENKRTIVAVLTIEETGKEYKGKAKCNPTDSFNQEVGETLAKMRAVSKYMKAEAREAKNSYLTATSICNRIQTLAENKEARYARTKKWLDEYVASL